MGLATSTWSPNILNVHGISMQWSRAVSPEVEQDVEGAARCGVTHRTQRPEPGSGTQPRGPVRGSCRTEDSEMSVAVPRTVGRGQR